MRSFLLFTISWIFCLSLLSCQSTSTAPPTLTSSPLAGLPEETSTNPNPIQPTSLPSTPLPSTPSEPLPSATATPNPRWIELTILSKGRITGTPLYSPDNAWFVIPTTNGISVYDPLTRKEYLQTNQPNCGNPCALAFHPHSNLLAAGYWKDIFIYDLTSKHLTGQAHIAPEYAILTDLAFSNDGSLLAAGYIDASQQTASYSIIFDTQSWKPVFTIGGTHPIFSPNSQELVTVSYDGINNQITWYSTRDGSRLHSLEGSRAWFLSDQELLVESKGAVRVIDGTTAKARLAISGTKAGPSSNGRTIALLVGSEARLYNLTDGSPLADFPLPTTGLRPEAIDGLYFSPGDEYVLATTILKICNECSNQSGPVLVWKATDGSLAAVIPAPRNRYWLAFNPAGEALAIAIVDQIQFFDLASGNSLFNLDTFSDYIDQLTITRDGKTLVAGHSQEYFGLRLWDLFTENGFPASIYLPGMPYEGEGDVWKLAASFNGDTASLGGYFWSLETGQLIGNTSERAISAAYDPKSSQMALGFKAGRLELWDADSLTLLQPLPVEPSNELTGDVISLSYSTDGKVLAAVYASPTPVVQLYGMPGGQPLQRLTGQAYIEAVLSLDGNRLATLSSPSDSFSHAFPFGFVNLWSLSGEKILRFQSENVECLAFNPDGQILALGLTDGSVELWSSSGEPIQKLDTHQPGVITGLAFTPDGHSLAVASGIGVVELWGLKP